MGRLNVKISKLYTGDGVTKTEAMKAWVGGWMKAARKKSKNYHQRGIKEIRFSKGKLRMIRKI